MCVPKIASALRLSRLQALILDQPLISKSVPSKKIFLRNLGTTMRAIRVTPEEATAIAKSDKCVGIFGKVEMENGQVTAYGITV
jgi:hypothetical protein